MDPTSPLTNKIPGSSLPLIFAGYRELRKQKITMVAHAPWKINSTGCGDLHSYRLPVEVAGK